ncbi:hypothetical protein Rhopal_001188-T1 [Rhodotorula paludigena]|uniref:Alpha/beta hydrolase fold-3 domain-containing protein n=1 Tax=Rhodotorula paludigena TaxID=86838 RepID=A0AAV5GHX3_9BASI|nr:hypothetical protein Rhopal_001188-T1 [Rhodotorula paludigena]
MPSLVRNTGLPCACLEYRLAPADPHPAQILDVVSGLELLTGPLLPLEAGEAKWDRTHLIVAGHSAGAFMAATLVLRPLPTHPASSARSSPFSVPDIVRQAVRGIICIDGIYDLPALLDEYPSYASFVSEAFGTDLSVLAAESPARWDRYNDDAGRDVRILVLHSKGDELLSLRQPRVFLRRVKQLFHAGGEAGVKDKADEATSEADERDLPANVEVDFGSLRGGHYEVVKGDELAQVIALRLR